jgi:polyferredoxin
MTIKTVRQLRRFSQILFFAVFFWLVLKTNFEVTLNPADSAEISLPYPVSIALQLDPLVGLATLLATGVLYKQLLWSLVILLPTIFLGRFFCGWVCPLGSLNHWVSEVKSESRANRGKGKIASNRYRRYQRLKYYVLFFMLAAALFGSLQTGLLDPLPLLARSLGTAVLPTVHISATVILGWVKSLGWAPLSGLAEAVFDTVAPVLLNFRQVHFHGILTIAVLFIVILIANRIFTRFWCRGLCPLGALLGLFSRFAIFGLQKEATACDQCGLCVLHCQGADNPEIGLKWRQAECHLCLNCQAACPKGALQFKFFPAQDGSIKNPAPEPRIDVSRRVTITSVAAGLVAVPLFRSGDAFSANTNSQLVRPPGSVAENIFLARCIRCGQCMRVCPNNALHPTMLESGFEGIWTPYLIARIGYCEPTCTLCGEVCPTGAIRHLRVLEKVGDRDHEPNRIGTAFVDQGRCLPWAMARPCIVCEEWCPTTPKAIYLEELTVADRAGLPVLVKRPCVDPSICTGCGACEYACPVVDRAAVYVTSVGESRSSTNQILLERNRKPLPGRS